MAAVYTGCWWILAGSRSLSKEKSPRLQDPHEPPHLPLGGGKAAAHVVVDADIAIQAQQINGDAPVQFGQWQCKKGWQLGGFSIDLPDRAMALPTLRSGHGKAGAGRIIGARDIQEP